jgi:hypothetical protein
MSAPQAANEKEWGKRSVEVEWKSGTPFMITTIYTPSAGIRASKGASKKLQMIGYGSCGDRGRQKGRTTATNENLRLLLEWRGRDTVCGMGSGEG